MGVRGYRKEMRQLLERSPLSFKEKQLCRATKSDSHLGPPTSGLQGLQLMDCTCHHKVRRAAEAASRRDPRRVGRKRLLGSGLRSSQGTYGVHLSLYSLAMVSMPPLLATAM